METENKGLIDVRDCPCDGCQAKPCGHPARCVKFTLWLNKTVDAVSMGCHEQVMWERDVAMEQLAEHGIPFGGISPDVVKVVRCKHCKWYKEERNRAYDGHFCLKMFEFVQPNDYCSNGERKVEDGN